MKIFNIIVTIISIPLIVITISTGINFMKYPEIYSGRLKYQLKNDLAAKDELAMEYYQRRYIDKGKSLYGVEKDAIFMPILSKSFK